ncbi:MULTISPECIES: hypothetical protein [Pseudomonas]|uniref:Uncharacterized protein n=1 Tax=Pseudomonas folii TaxID=2762593 RepID=A0ABR7AV66_9PSED|nr:MULTISPECIES: hypothetical protein [Pseudomonas]MBC3948807.1 hypothetical protein [Pseudomonas folii]
MLPSTSQLLLQTSVDRLAARAAVRGQSANVAPQSTSYFGYWFSHWRA